MKIVEIAYSDRVPTTIGPLSYFASKLWTYENGRSDYALSIWLGRLTIYAQVGVKYKFNAWLK